MTAAHSPETDAKVPRILVVDDTPDNLFLMNGLFEDRYQVLLAPSGREALDIVMSAEPPDMVLLDIMMPDMDGYEVLRRIRQHPPTANIPVIFLTALASAQDERLGRELGAEDYLTKPIDPDRVIARVEAHVAQTAQARRMDALSEKLARHLAPDDWQRLFHGEAAATIAFEQKSVNVLHIEPAAGAAAADGAFEEEVEWLAARHQGSIDRFAYGAKVVFFEDAETCRRMVEELGQHADAVRLADGVQAGVCDVGSFRLGATPQRTLLGDASLRRLPTNAFHAAA